MRHVFIAKHNFRLSLLVFMVAILAACSSGSTSTTVPEPTVTSETTSIAPTPTTTASTVALTSTTGIETTTPTSTTGIETTTPTVGGTRISINVTEGVIEGGGRIDVALGDLVEIVVISDVSDEAHLHGYDLTVELEPGVENVIEFTADIPGIFEFELENAGTLLAELEIAP